MVKVNFTERQIYLLKKNEFVIGFKDLSTKVYDRLPLSTRRFREIVKLTNESDSKPSLHFTIYEKIAEYCLNISEEDFYNAIWESTIELEIQNNIFGLKQILEANIHRYVYGVAYFSPKLEEWIIYGGKNPIITKEEIEAWTMFVNKQNGILPTQYHHFYEQGDTIIYNEHVEDLAVVAKMWDNKLKREQKEEEAKQNNPFKSGKAKAPFAGGKFHYKK